MFDIDSKDFHVQFGKFIRNVREENQIYQREVAEKVGITQSYMSYIESGSRDIDIVLAIKLCAVLGVDIQGFINKYIGEEEVVVLKEEIKEEP